MPMSLHKDDARSKKIVFVANCILNANNKVLEAARYPGMFPTVVKALVDAGVGVIQMPCPETLYMGNQRWYNSRNLYDNVGYRRHCRTLAEQMADYLENYEKIGYQVPAILTCDGSPSCGITKSSYCEDWGGRPKAVERILVSQPGVFIEELTAVLEERHLKCPQIYGLPMDDHEISTEQIAEDFLRFLKEGETGG